jgi:hypothetical protein
VDSTARYLELFRLGKDAFFAQAAPAALVRRRSEPLKSAQRPIRTMGVPALGDDEDTTLVMGEDGSFQFTGGGEGPDVMVYPLTKKPGAPFSDMITVGRTANNDVVLNDVTVSRFHAYFRLDEETGAWTVCDAGSKNGSVLGGTKLEGRAETSVESGAVLHFGDVETLFYSVGDLYTFLETVPFG